MNKDIKDLSYAEALEQVSSLVMATDALVVDMCNAPGYPSLMVLVKDCMPLFLFVKPDALENQVWSDAKKVVESKLASVNATWFDITAFEDMDWLLGEILHRTKPGEIKRPKQDTAEQQGFDFEPKRDRKAWLK